MSLLPLALSLTLCLVFSCLVFFLRDQARRPCRDAARIPPPAGAGEPVGAGNSPRPG